MLCNHLISAIGFAQEPEDHCAETDHCKAAWLESTDTLAVNAPGLEEIPCLHVCADVNASCVFTNVEKHEKPFTYFYMIHASQDPMEQSPDPPSFNRDEPWSEDDAEDLDQEHKVSW